MKFMRLSLGVVLGISVIWYMTHDRYDHATFDLILCTLLLYGEDWPRPPKEV